MDNDMEEYYKVLQYLRETHIDRQYPCEFKDVTTDIKTSCTVVESTEHTSDFDKTYKISNISNGDLVQVILPYPHDYVDTDTFEILFYSEDNIQSSDIEIGLSNIKEGVLDNFKITSSSFISDESTVQNGYNLFKYRIRNTTTQMQKKNRKVSSVNTINIYFKKNVSEFYLSNLVFRVDNFTLTLEDLDDQILAGQNYIINQLRVVNASQIPQQLQHLQYKAGAAYSWLIWWENEGKCMDDGTREGRNYATRLFDQIDHFIDKFIEANPDYGLHEINMDLVGYTKYCAYKIKPCKRGRFR